MTTEDTTGKQGIGAGRKKRTESSIAHPRPGGEQGKAVQLGHGFYRHWKLSGRRE
jgi:hypothetical protein